MGREAAFAGCVDDQNHFAFVVGEIDSGALLWFALLVTVSEFTDSQLLTVERLEIVECGSGGHRGLMLVEVMRGTADESRLKVKG